MREPRTLLDEYRRQKDIKLEGNLYHNTQVELAYNSNRIERIHPFQDGEESGWLLDTCRAFQDRYAAEFLPLVPHLK